MIDWHETGLQYEVDVPFSNTAPNLNTDPTQHFRVLAEKALLLARLHEAYWAARTDALTGAGNMRAYRDDLTHLINRHSYAPNELFAVLYLDVDGMKRVNEASAEGHLQGDLLLKTISSFVRTRTNEPPRSPDSIYRIGGDEFTIIIKGIRQASHDRDAEVTAKRIAKRYEDNINAEISNHDMWAEVLAGLSAGAAVYQPGDTLESLTRRAEQDMFANKEARKKHLESRGIIFEDSRKLVVDDPVQDARQTRRTWVVVDDYGNER